MELVSVCGRLDPASGRDSARALIGRLYSGLPRDDTRQVQASARVIGASVQARCELSSLSPPRVCSSIGARKAFEHPDMTEELAEVLSTPTVDVEYQIETGVSVR